MKKRLTTLAVTGLLLLDQRTCLRCHRSSHQLVRHEEKRWTSADGYDDVKMLNALGLKADIIGYYPWTNTFLLRRL
jgi:hypothetical protein